MATKDSVASNEMHLVDPELTNIHISGHVAKSLSIEEFNLLKAQNSRLVSEFQSQKLEKDALKHWDLFYKRNTTKFFKDRHWTTREFEELSKMAAPTLDNVLLEIGCGVGNFIYPLLEDGLNFHRIYACDLSPRAIELLQNHTLYDPEKIFAFQTDITKDDCFLRVNHSINLATMIFVLSAIHPNNFQKVVDNLYKVLASGGIILLRDYGLYDMAQIRFKPGCKIANNFYMRHDGTRSYYFSVEELKTLFESVGFVTSACDYIQRRTVNVGKNIDVLRIFIQAKFIKP